MLNSDKILLGLIVVYLVLMALSVYERSWAKALYWFAAAQIATSIFLLK